MVTQIPEIAEIEVTFSTAFPKEIHETKKQNNNTYFVQFKKVL